jgi:hypothetical protein
MNADCRICCALPNNGIKMNIKNKLLILINFYHVFCYIKIICLQGIVMNTTVELRLHSYNSRSLSVLEII